MTLRPKSLAVALLAVALGLPVPSSGQGAPAAEAAGARPAPATPAPAPTMPPAPAPAPAAAPAAATPVTASSGPSDAAAKLLASSDAAYLRRDEPGQLEILKSSLDQAERLAPDDFDVLWRISRFYFWTADDPRITNEEKSRLGKLGWDYGDRAAAKRADRVEGWFYGASGVGQYSLGISVVTALFQGMESKFTERLAKAQSIDPSLNGYAADVSWGRYWYELPWPKYDAEKSEKAYRRALRHNRDNLRAKAYLAELFMKEDYPKEAQKLLEEVLAAKPGAYDAPEERRSQEIARTLIAKLKS
jgi:hypothetical protein